MESTDSGTGSGESGMWMAVNTPCADAWWKATSNGIKMAEHIVSASRWGTALGSSCP